MTTTEQKLKWVQTDKTCRFWGAFTVVREPGIAIVAKLFLEIEPNTVFSFNRLGSRPFQTKGWRIRQQDAQKENKYPEGKTFKTRKAAKQWVEWYYNKDAGEEKIVSDPAVQELIAESK